MATSGTVSTTVFQTRRIMDHAFRRCKKVPQEVVGEQIDVAKDLLYLFLSSLANKGLRLWNIDKLILPMYEREMSVTCPLGVVDMLNCNLRTATRITGTASASEGVADNAFDGLVNTACTQVAAAGTITMELTTATAVWTFGILPNASGTWAYVIEASTDGITYVPLITETAQVMVAGEWVWYDVEGVTAYSFYRLRATGATVLNVAELVYQNTPREIPLYKLNRDDYANLPDKPFPGRPDQFYYNKQLNQSIITLWPSPSYEYTFAQLVCYVQQYIQDVGTLAQEIEVPQRWYLAVVTNLAAQLGRELKDVDPALLPQLDADAKMELDNAWAGETDGADVFWRPNISPYTR